MYTDEYIREFYKTHTRQEVADLLGINYNSVGHVLKRCGAYEDKKVKKTTIVNEDYFRDGSPSIDYILGYIVGDGCVRNKRTGQQEVNIWSKDTDHLIKIAEVIGYTGSLKSGINFRSDQVVDYLISKGIKPRKSKSGGIPVYKNKRDFLRGLFDSDGCVTYQHGDKLRLYFFGHKDTMKEVQKILKDELGLERNIRDREDGISEVAIFKQEDVMKVAEYMYKYSTIHMDRKYNRFYGEDIVRHS